MGILIVTMAEIEKNSVGIVQTQTIRLVEPERPLPTGEKAPEADAAGASAPARSAFAKLRDLFSGK